MGLPRELRHNMWAMIYCENRNEATLQRYFQNCAGNSSCSGSAVVRAGLVTTRLALSAVGLGSKKSGPPWGRRQPLMSAASFGGKGDGC